MLRAKLDCFAALCNDGVASVMILYAPIAIFGSASAFAFISRSARRYSTGITLRNFGSQVFQFAEDLGGARRARQLGVTRDQHVQPLDVGAEQVLEHVDPAMRLEIAGVMVGARR